MPIVVLHLKSYKGPRFYRPNLRKWKRLDDGRPATGRDLATIDAALAATAAAALHVSLTLDDALAARLGALRPALTFDDYITIGTAYYRPFDPKLVLIPPVERKNGDCHCPCMRSMIPLRVAEGTTIHSLQGINVGVRPTDLNPHPLVVTGALNPSALLRDLNPGLTGQQAGQAPRHRFWQGVLRDEDVRAVDGRAEPAAE